jgi:hypothetical protein
LLSLELSNAVLDIHTDRALLINCLNLISSHQGGLESTQMGAFGIYPISLNVHHEGTISIFVDGPSFDEDRVQSAAIWPEKESLLRIIAEAIDMIKRNEEVASGNELS